MPTRCSAIMDKQRFLADVVDREIRLRLLSLKSKDGSSRPSRDVVGRICYHYVYARRNRQIAGRCRRSYTFLLAYSPLRTTFLRCPGQSRDERSLFLSALRPQGGKHAVLKTQVIRRINRLAAVPDFKVQVGARRQLARIADDGYRFSAVHPVTYFFQ